MLNEGMTITHVSQRVLKRLSVIRGRSSRIAAGVSTLISRSQQKGKTTPIMLLSMIYAYKLTGCVSRRIFVHHLACPSGLMMPVRTTKYYPDLSGIMQWSRF